MLTDETGLIKTFLIAYLPHWYLWHALGTKSTTLGFWPFFFWGGGWGAETLGGSHEAHSGEMFVKITLCLLTSSCLQFSCHPYTHRPQGQGTSCLEMVLDIVKFVAHLGGWVPNCMYWNPSPDTASPAAYGIGVPMKSMADGPLGSIFVLFYASWKAFCFLTQCTPGKVEWPPTHMKTHNVHPQYVQMKSQWPFFSHILGFHCAWPHS